MARIRTIKPEFFASLSRKRLSIGARWLMAGLLCHVDDSGRMLASLRMIAGNVLPFDDDITELQVAKWLDELLRDGILMRYVVGGAEYLCIPKFNTHQRISHPTASRLPPPPETSGMVDTQGVRSVGSAPELPLLTTSRQDVTFSTPESFAKTSGESPESLRMLGGGRLPPQFQFNSQINSGAEKSTDVSDEDRVDRSRRNPDAPPPRPHGAHYDKHGAIPLNGTGVGFMDNRHLFPETPEELLAQQPDWPAKYPQLDGKNGRPDLITAVRSHWSYYIQSRSRMGGGHTNALAQLAMDLSKDCKQHRYQWEKDGSKAVERKFRNKDLYDECLVVAEKEHASCPPNPEDDKEAWIQWAKNNQRICTIAKARLKERGAA